MLIITSDNVIPAMAEATFNVRFNNKHKSSSIKNRLKSNNQFN